MRIIGTIPACTIPPRRVPGTVIPVVELVVPGAVPGGCPPVVVRDIIILLVRACFVSVGAGDMFRIDIPGRIAICRIAELLFRKGFLFLAVQGKRLSSPKVVQCLAVGGIEVHVVVLNLGRGPGGHREAKTSYEKVFKLHNYPLSLVLITDKR